MQTTSEVVVPVSKKRLWTGWIITILVGSFLLFDATIKLMMNENVLEANKRLGYPDSTTIGIGLTLLISTILYLIPQTAILGAILLTAYLGGATTTHVRVDDPFYFPIVFGFLVWLGIYLRERKLHFLIPFRRNVGNVS